jgi:hypothetical protein
VQGKKIEVRLLTNNNSKNNFMQKIIISFLIVSVFITPVFAFIVSQNHDIIPDTSLSFFTETRIPVNPKFENLPINQTKPKGWIKSIMDQDITEGFVAHLDELAPKLMSDDAFNTARRKDVNDIPSVGNQELTGAEWEISMQWWVGETLGNWWEGYLGNAYMTDNRQAIKKINSIVKYLLAAQDEDGYMGIYSKEMRYKHKGSNGELWAQTTLFRMLLAYYEFTGDENVMQAVEKAMAVTMGAYNEDKQSPFDVSIDYGGITHGLMMTDVCETLYRITKNKKYNDYAVYLYQEFSKYPINRAFNDLRYEQLVDEPDSLFQSHAAHTYEQFRTLISAYYICGYPELENAYNIAMKKLNNCILPSGTGFGNEWLNKENSKPDFTGAEMCAMLELRNFYLSALQKTGEIQFADDAEKITFNAMQGARNQNGKGIVYCKTDNCYTLNGKSPQSGFEEEDGRYKYSPTHADMAVCCNPNYGRNLPYYVSNMWMRAHDGFAAVMYGPASLTSEFNGVKVKIDEQTNYPFSDTIEFVIHTENEVEFKMYLRNPAWSKRINIKIDAAEITQENGFYFIQKKWKNGDKISISFENEIKPVFANNNEIALQRGALVYALKIPHQEEIIKEYEIDGFTDYLTFPKSESYKNIELINSEVDNSYGFTFEKEDNNTDPLYNGNTHLTGEVYDNETDRIIEVKLVPMGETVLRRVTFPVK